MAFLNFKKRIKLTTKAAAIPSSQTKFPVAVDTKQVDATFWANVQTDGGDIRLTTIADLQVAADLVQIDTIGETLTLWFDSVTISSLGGDEYYLYYDGDGTETFPLPSDTFGRENVYDANSVQVTHTTVKVGAGLEDATSNGNDWIEQGTGITYDQIGQFGRATDFPSSNAAIFDQTSIFDIGTANQEITTSCWINSTNIGNNRNIASIVGSSGEILLMNGTNGRVSTRVNGTNFNGNTNNSALTWHRLSIKYKNTSPFDISLYLNGVLDNAPIPQRAPVGSTGNWIFGGNRNGNDSMFGLLSELTISDTLRSDDWLLTEYNNQVDTDNMWTASASENVPMNGATERSGLSIGISIGI